jgi:hypothetical protein
MIGSILTASRARRTWVIAEEIKAGIVADALDMLVPEGDLLAVVE